MNTLYNTNETILISNTHDGLYAPRRTEKRAGCALPRSCVVT